MTGLEQAQARCAEITRQKGPNFSVGFEVLPADKLTAVHACYAFCRLVDDLVDECGPAPDADPLGAWRQELELVYEGAPRHEVGVALADAVLRYPIPQVSFERLIQGCEEDLQFVQPADLAALERYCDLVAAPIGEMSLAIFGAQDPQADTMGRALAHALQWTNILRDVREDAQRGRIYLPATWMQSCGLDPRHLDRNVPTAAFLELMRRGIATAQRHFARARSLPEFVSADSRTAVRLMAGVYAAILERIAEDPGRVLRERVGLRRGEKSALVRRLSGPIDPPAAAREGFSGR